MAGGKGNSLIFWYLRRETLSGSDVLILNFFGRLYTKPERNSWRVEGLERSPISTQSAEWLDRPFFGRGGALLQLRPFPGW